MIIRLKKTKLEINFYFVALITLLLLFDKSSKTVLCIVGAVLHEAGHLLCLLWWGDVPSKVSLMPFGMVIERRGRVSLSFNKEAVAALAGPAVNLALAGLLALVYQLNQSELLLFSIAVNIGLGGFNLLPLEPLDGSRILHALLSKKLSDAKSKKITTAVSFTLLFPLAACGFYVLIASGYNISLLVVAVYISILLMFKGSKA